MSDLNMQYVREFFELNRFNVLTHWQHDARLTRGADSTSLLFVENTQAELGAPKSVLLTPAELTGLERALVEVRAWHGDRFYPSVVESSSVLAHVAQPETRELAETVFAGAPFATILVISELPASPKHRNRSLELFREKGIEHILEFPTLLQDMLQRISVEGNYAPSQTLQTLRLLKRYQLLRIQQLEFTFPHDPLAATDRTPSIGTPADTDTP